MTEQVFGHVNVFFMCFPFLSCVAFLQPPIHLPDMWVFEVPGTAQQSCLVQKREKKIQKYTSVGSRIFTPNLVKLEHL